MTYTLFIENTNGNYWFFPVSYEKGLEAIDDIREGIRSNWMSVECASLKCSNGVILCRVFRKDYIK